MRGLSDTEVFGVFGGQYTQCEWMAIELYWLVSQYESSGCPQVNPQGCAQAQAQIQSLIDIYVATCL